MYNEHVNRTKAHGIRFSHIHFWASFISRNKCDCHLKGRIRYSQSLGLNIQQTYTFLHFNDFNDFNHFHVHNWQNSGT